jgi:hypothetical protein
LRFVVGNPHFAGYSIQFVASSRALEHGAQDGLAGSSAAFTLIIIKTMKGSMAYVSSNYANNAAAPVGRWTCAPTSNLQPFEEVPGNDKTKGKNLCGQCVSYVKKVCPFIPSTTDWGKGPQVKGNKSISPGTVIATFNASGHYEGHAAIYVSQDGLGIKVYDQYVTPPTPKAVGPRLLRWGAHGNSNNGNNFYVVE